MQDYPVYQLSLLLKIRVEVQANCPRRLILNSYIFNHEYYCCLKLTLLHLHRSPWGSRDTRTELVDPAHEILQRQRYRQFNSCRAHVVTFEGQVPPEKFHLVFPWVTTVALRTCRMSEDSYHNASIT